MLYQLQIIDLQLDELQELKGDLPGIVAKLKENLAQRVSARSTLEEKVKHSIVSRDKIDTSIIDLREKMEKWKTQQFEVKTNKQYDMLAREIDHAQESIARLTKEMEMLEGDVANAKNDIAVISPDVEGLEAELNERQAELDAVNKEHEDEELKLNHEREKALVRIKPSDLTMYERIRKAKDGKAVVPIKRNACGGCYNRIPPQKVLELRKNDVFMTCERCGRLLVSDEIAGINADS